MKKFKLGEIALEFQDHETASTVPHVVTRPMSPKKQLNEVEQMELRFGLDQDKLEELEELQTAIEDPVAFEEAIINSHLSRDLARSTDEEIFS